MRAAGPGVHLETKGGAFLESIRQYLKRTDKLYLLLCIFSSTMAVVALASWAAKQGSGFATDELTGAVIGIGDYRRALVQAGAAVLGIILALLLSCIDYRSLVKVWPVHVALTWGLVLPTLFIRNVTIGFNAGDSHGAAEDAQQQVELIRSLQILSNAFQESTTFRFQMHTGPGCTHRQHKPSLSLLYTDGAAFSICRVEQPCKICADA